MTDSQIWQTIALDLKRAANYHASGNINKANYYLAEAKGLYAGQKLVGKIKRIEQFIKFEGNPEEILLSSSLITTRI
jgi:hypothetical protein